MVYDEDGVLDFDDPAPFDGDVPTPFLAPRNLSIQGDTTLGTFAIRNKRLDSFSWGVAGAPAWIVNPAIGTSGALAPGEETVVDVEVDRTGLEPGVRQGNITIATDFGEDVVAVTMIVPIP